MDSSAFRGEEERGKKTAKIEVSVTPEMKRRVASVADELYSDTAQGGGNRARVMRDAFRFFYKVKPSQEDLEALESLDDGARDPGSGNVDSFTAVVKVSNIALWALRILYKNEYEEVMEL